MTPSIEISPLSPDNLPDYLDYFDQRAFADNPDWQSCYCHFLFADRAVKPWGAYTLEENRQGVSQLILANKMRGYLAYDAGQVVGWCNAGPKLLFPALMDTGSADPATVGSIGCFVISKPYRRQGMARMLLDAACEGFRQQGLSLAEGYPRPRSKNEASNHFGPISMFLSAGFEKSGEKAGKRPILRKALV